MSSVLPGGAAHHRPEEASRIRSHMDVSTAWLMLAPACLFLVALFIVPVGYVLVLSVADPTLSLTHYRRIFTTPLYIGVIINTFKISLIVTIICLILGYPLAYVITRRNDRISFALLTIVGMSFWTGFLVRSYAWLVLLGNKGPLAAFYRALLLVEPPQLLFTSFASILGLTHILLPYMVLALYSVMRKIDPLHLRAASGLGARPFRAFWEVFLPMSAPGVVSGSLLVFTICLGFYITPVLLGTPKDMMISQLISQQIEQLLAWGFASAVAVVLLVPALACLAIYTRFAGLDQLRS
jgi:putative spermidine/putrescine transport system permease protein